MKSAFWRWMDVAPRPRTWREDAGLKQGQTGEEPVTERGESKAASQVILRE